MAGCTRWRSQAVGFVRYCRQPFRRIYHMGRRQERWRSSATPPCAGTHTWTSHPVGRASPDPRRLSSRSASSTDSTLAYCSRRRRARRLASPIPCSLRCGSQSAVFLHCLAWRSVRPQDSAYVDGQSASVVDSIALRVRGTGRRLHLLWDMEDARPEQDK